MGFAITKEIRLTGTTSYNLVGNDKVTLEIKGTKVVDFSVPDARTGTLTITIDGRLDDQ